MRLHPTLEENSLHTGSHFEDVSKYFNTPFNQVIDKLSGKKGLIVAAGGLAPGVNLVMQNLVRLTAPGTNIYGLKGGFPGIEDPHENITRIVASNDIRPGDFPPHEKVMGIGYRNSTSDLLLSMGRGSQGEKDAANLCDYLKAAGFNFLVTVGGNGTLKATQTIHKLLNGSGIQVIHLPKTVDGDLYGVSFGIYSAAEKVRRSILELVGELGANGNFPAINLIEAMGWDSGQLALEVAKTCNQVDLVIVPEIELSAPEILKRILDVYEQKGDGANVLIAEGVRSIPGLEGQSTKGKMLQPLAEFLRAQLPKESRVTARGWDYNQRSVEILAGRDAGLVDSLVHTGLYVLASGAQGATIINAEKALDLSSDIPSGEVIIGPKTKAALMRMNIPYSKMAHLLPEEMRY